MKIDRYCKILVTVALFGGATASQAALFDVTSVNFTAGTASGTSNGVGFTFSGGLWNVRTTIDESFNGFTGGNFAIPMPASDRLHTGGSNPTWTFDSQVQSVLVYLADDPDGNYTNFWDFGVTATAVSGNVEVIGTTFRLTHPDGGIVRLSGINSNVLSSVNIGDGNDTALVVESVPEPGTMALLGMAGLACLRKRKRRA